MTFRNLTLALCVTFGATAFATSPLSFAPSAERSLRTEAATYDHTSELPQGDYISEDGDLTMRITKTGFVKADFSIVLTNGAKAPMEFPRKLRFLKDEEIFRTTGDTLLSWWTNMGMITCRYPVKLEIRDLGNGDKLRARFEIPANMALDPYGRCIAYGTMTKSIKFERE